MRLNKASCLFQHPADVSLSWNDVRLDELRQGDQIQPLPPELGLFLTVFVEQHPDPNKAKFHVSKGNHIHRRCKQLNGDLPKGPKQLVNRWAADCVRHLLSGLLRSPLSTVLATCQFFTFFPVHTATRSRKRSDPLPFVFTISKRRGARPRGLLTPGAVSVHNWPRPFVCASFPTCPSPNFIPSKN